MHSRTGQASSYNGIQSIIDFPKDAGIAKATTTHAQANAAAYRSMSVELECCCIMSAPIGPAVIPPRHAQILVTPDAVDRTFVGYASGVMTYKVAQAPTTKKYINTVSVVTDAGPGSVAHRAVVILHATRRPHSSHLRPTMLTRAVASNSPGTSAAAMRP